MSDVTTVAAEDTRAARHEAIRTQEFGSVFAVTSERGTVLTGWTWLVGAPETVDPDMHATAANPIAHTNTNGEGFWQLPMTGFSGQCAGVNNDSVWMHDSEHMSEAMLDKVIATPGLWAFVPGTYECEYGDEHPDTHHECEPLLEGWTLVFMSYSNYAKNFTTTEIGN